MQGFMMREDVFVGNKPAKVLESSKNLPRCRIRISSGLEGQEGPVTFEFRKKSINAKILNATH